MQVLSFRHCTLMESSVESFLQKRDVCIELTKLVTITSPSSLEDTLQHISFNTKPFNGKYTGYPKAAASASWESNTWAEGSREISWDSSTTTYSGPKLSLVCYCVEDRPGATTSFFDIFFRSMLASESQVAKAIPVLRNIAIDLRQRRSYYPTWTWLLWLWEQCVNSLPSLPRHPIISIKPWVIAMKAWCTL